MFWVTFEKTISTVELKKKEKKQKKERKVNVTIFF